MAQTADDFDWDDGVATLGDRLAKAREAAGMTEAQLARRLGVKLATLRNWEADRSEPRANRLQMLSGLLNVSFIWLISGTSAESGETRPRIDLQEVVAELSELRIAQNRLAERTGRLEKRLRQLTAQT